MVKCGSCGKYLSSLDSIKCTKCPGAFHRACISLPAAATVSATWLCPGCKQKTPRENSNIPMKDTATTSSGADQQYAATVAGVSASTSAHITAASDTHSITAQVNDVLAIQIRAFREELSEVRNYLREIRSELSEFHSSVKSCNDRIKGVEDRLSILEQKFEENVPQNVDTLEDTISALREELNTRDQELLLNDIDIAGVPETTEVNLVHFVKVLATKLGTELQDGDIVHVERVGPVQRNMREIDNSGTAMPPRPRNIILRLARRTTRDQLISAARVRRVITTTDLELQGAPRRIYINERLTRTNRQLFGRAREAARHAHYKYVWTREGRIFTRKEDGRTVERVRSEKDLTKIFGTS